MNFKKDYNTLTEFQFEFLIVLLNTKLITIWKSERAVITLVKNTQTYNKEERKVLLKVRDRYIQAMSLFNKIKK